MPRPRNLYPMKDNPSLLDKAAAYIRSHKEVEYAHIYSS